MADYYSPDSVILLQQLEKTTKSALAHKADISSATMSKVLNKQKLMTEQFAGRVATEWDYPIEFFESDVPKIPVIELTYRHTSKSSVSELNAVSAEFSLLSFATKRLSSLIGIHPKVEWIDLVAPRNSTISHGDIERLAVQTREFLGIPKNGCVKNVTRTLERCGIVVAPLKTLSPIPGEESLNSDGVTYPDFSREGTCIIGYTPNDTTGDRDRFTKAHELGHLILHKYRKPSKYRDLEREAHAFAGAFLMPQSDVNVLLSPNTMLSDIARLKSAWGMSMAAIISRGYNAGIFSKDRWRSLYIQLSARGWRKNEPVQVVAEKPILFRSLIERQYGDTKGAVDSFALEKELRVPFRYLDVWSNGLREQGSDIGFRAKRFE